MTRFCPACRKVLLAGALTVQIMNNDYHSSCLHCIKCGKNLFDKGFVKRADGKLCCEEGTCDQPGTNSSPTNNSAWLVQNPTATQTSPRQSMTTDEHGLKLRSHSIKNQQTYSINDQFLQQQQQQPQAVVVAPIPVMNHNSMRTIAQAPYATIDDNNTNNYSNGGNGSASSGSESIRSGASSPTTQTVGKYFVDSSPKLYANNGAPVAAQTVHSYNLGNYLKRSKRNDSSHVIGMAESTPHQIETYPVQAESSRNIQPQQQQQQQMSPEALKTCAKCHNEVVEKERFVHDQRAYHKECLTCSLCKKELYRMKKIEGGGVSDNKGEIQYYCEPCYAELFAPRCGKCNKPVTQYMLSSKYGDKVFHKECFVCGRCKQSLANKEFSKFGNLNVCKSCV